MQNESVIFNDVNKNSKEAGVRSQVAGKAESHDLNLKVDLRPDTLPFAVFLRPDTRRLQPALFQSHR
jgi:hypothetical protein